jgi:pimeloyl-ACP methyl ester carboxylesterase
MFATAASGLDWEACRALLEERIPGVVAQSITDADTFFGVELPAVTEWTFGPEQAAAIRRPVLSVIGAKTQPLWVEIAEFIRSWLPHVEECTIGGVGHLLQIKRPQPVAQAIANFLERNAISGSDARRLHPDDPTQPLVAPRA